MLLPLPLAPCIALVFGATPIGFVHDVLSMTSVNKEPATEDLLFPLLQVLGWFALQVHT